MAPRHTSAPVDETAEPFGHLSGARRYLLRRELLLSSPVVRVTQHPGGDPTDLRQAERNRRNGIERAMPVRCRCGATRTGTTGQDADVLVV
jgi:hypothetical protein